MTQILIYCPLLVGYSTDIFHQITVVNNYSFCLLVCLFDVSRIYFNSDPRADTLANTSRGKKIPAQDFLAREFSSSCIIDTIYFAPFNSQDLLNKQLKMNSKAQQLRDREE